jgi:GcrA cell cycle regulator
MIWDNETESRLRVLWAEGHSTAEIGRRMGISKNAVVGKAHRLDLDARPSPIAREGFAVVRPARTAVTLPPLPSQEAAMLPMPPAHVPSQVVIQLPRVTRRCEFLSGDTKPYVRCDKPAVLGKSWCRDCMGVVFTRTPRWGSVA